MGDVSTRADSTEEPLAGLGGALEPVEPEALEDDPSNETTRTRWERRDVDKESGAGAERWRRRQTEHSAPNWRFVNAPTRRLPRDWLFRGADEIFRGIYTRAGSSLSETLAVCSAMHGEGKTSICVGLGATLAQDFPDRRVVVVETDLEHPALAVDFGLEHGPGLIDCLQDLLPVEEAYRATLMDNFFLVPAGDSEGVAGRWLRTARMAAAIDQMRENFDIVILETPPLLANSDALLLTDMVDGVIFVVRSGVTPVSALQHAIDQIDSGKLRGVVMNGVQSSVPRWIRRLFRL